MEPGFSELGWREAAAVLIAVVIIVDWAADRYLRPRRARSTERAGAPGRETRPSGSSV